MLKIASGIEQPTVASGISGQTKEGYEFVVPNQVVVYNNSQLAGNPDSVKRLAMTEISGKEGTQLSPEIGTKGKSTASGYDPMLLETYGFRSGEQRHDPNSDKSVSTNGFDSLGCPFRSGEQRHDPNSDKSVSGNTGDIGIVRTVKNRPPQRNPLPKGEGKTEIFSSPASLQS